MSPVAFEEIVIPTGYFCVCWIICQHELNKLKFASNSRFVKFDNFLYDNVLKTSFNPDPSYSEYFFDITVDDEIQGDISSIGISQADIPINDEELCEDQ